MTIQSAQQQLQIQLKNVYPEREAANITDWVMEHLTGQKKIDRLLSKQDILPAEQLARLNGITADLLKHKPVQYVLNEAWFCGMKFYINESVLIPRPETEELVDWVEGEIKKSKIKNQKLIDIGTGSGCIAVSLKKRAGDVEITSVDISKEALEVAARNARILGVDINLLNIDFLDEQIWDRLPVFDMIVSNPPYIKESEKNSMSENVLGYEPFLALFVPDTDPLLFYRKIATFAKTHLSKEGSIFLEINEAMGDEIIALYESAGYHIELKKDLQGKNRMAKVTTV